MVNFECGSMIILAGTYSLHACCEVSLMLHIRHLLDCLCTPAETQWLLAELVSQPSQVDYPSLVYA
jgi:hypothetical protein